MIQRHQARPDQAGFGRRLLAFGVDTVLIALVSVIVFFAYSEIKAARTGGKGEFSRFLGALKGGESVVIGTGGGHSLPQAESKAGRERKIYAIGGETFKIIYEFMIGYVYYILFFRFGGRTPGKRLLRLRVIDLEGGAHLGWFQSLERTHGYTASALLGFLGFLQVLWDRHGLTMHDKLAGTTVIRLGKKTQATTARMSRG